VAPEFLDVLGWQWEKKAIPYWRVAGRFAGDHGVRVAIEAHPGFLVYNTETALRLRAEAGRAVGVNLDPGNLFCIEHEDALASVDEGLRAAVDMLHRVVLTEPPVTPWWT
jgi:sugar phosphate isomerase/epimerase